MKYLLASIAFIVCTICYGYGQSKGEESLKEQAKKMGQAFLSGDYNAFSKYIDPKVLKMMGGARKMEDVLAKTTADMKTQGMMFENITFGEPSKVIKNGNELQCTIPQHTYIKISQQRVVSTTTLIAISIDNGSNWTFLDTSNKDMATVRKLLPNLSSAITIPPQQPPVRVNN